jgi:hypothetical protein
MSHRQCFHYILKPNIPNVIVYADRWHLLELSILNTEKNTKKTFSAINDCAFIKAKKKSEIYADSHV